MPTLPAPFTHFRTCYKHPAGDVGVALTRWLVARGWLVAEPAPADAPPLRGGIPQLGGFRVTAMGAEGLAGMGIGGAATGGYHKACADYTVRLPNGRRGVPHVAGTLGAGVTGWLLAQGYAARLPEAVTVYEGRTLALTPAGRHTLADLGVLPAGE